MPGSRHQQIKTIFLDAKEKPLSQRGGFLDHACAGDPELRSELEILLAASEEIGAVLNPDSRNSAAGEKIGAKIGRYKILELIGEGGFGNVYMAEQETPVRRKVALKIIKLGMDTKQVIARFEAERQALAMMDHPNIAKVFDAGTTETGRPYFVMDLVRGLPITQYCDQEHLSIRQRIELFSDVCKAIQHAHQKGIIHRDIKPSNVLVTMHDDKPVPKVIDFGIAKAIDQRLTEKTLFTEFRQFVGTPAYVSPEQAQMGDMDVDTRSDVYSLGVLLYELLAGSTPLESSELMRRGYDQMQQMIREKEPARPSDRLSSLTSENLTAIAKRRSSDARELSRAIRGDADWIVIKCLEKDRRRRYESASALAKDLERYLANEPVEATPPSVVYRLQKFIRRNRTDLGIAATILLLITVSIGLYIHGIRSKERQIEAAFAQVKAERQEADAERDEATKQQKIVSALNDFLIHALGSASLPEDFDHKVKFHEGDQFCLELLNLDENTWPERYQRIGIDMETVLGVVRGEEALGILDPIVFQREEAAFFRLLNLEKQKLSPGDPYLVSVYLNTGFCEKVSGRLDKAEELVRQSLKIASNTPASRRQVLMYTDCQVDAIANILGLLLEDENKLAESEKMLRQAMAMRRVTFPHESNNLSNTLTNLAHVLFLEGKNAEAEQLYREALDMQRKLWEPTNLVLAITMNDFAQLLLKERKFVEAESLFRQALQIRTTRAPNAPATKATAQELVDLLEQTGRASEAAVLRKQFALSGASSQPVQSR